MRLLDTSTARFKTVDDPGQECYAILSHVWDHTNGEQSLQDILETYEYTPHNPWSAGFEDQSCPTALTVLSAKIRDCCVFARLNGYRYIWVDTCCIDKTSSTELSEAINSMYKWYSQASICYAFLEDVDDFENPRSRTSCFRQSRWFTRGWTLQELIAPTELLFLSRDWRVLGSKETLSDVIEEITGVDRDVLTHKQALESVSVARRMSWAARRITTREEDEAYSLMGIFGVNMSTIYGEGRNAFVRLQREILEHCPDQSIFAWGHVFPDHSKITTRFRGYSEQLRLLRQCDIEPPSQDACLFAASPSAFANSADIVPIPLTNFATRLKLHLAPPHYTVTSHGVHVYFPVLTDEKPQTFTLAVLACENSSGHLVALILHEISGSNQHAIGNYLLEDTLPSSQLYYRCTTLIMDYPPPINNTSDFILCDFYIPSHGNSTTVPRRGVRTPHTLSSPTFGFAGPCEIIVPRWLPAQLQEFGFKLSFSRPNNIDRRVPTSHVLLDWDSGSWNRVLMLRGQDGEAIDIHLLLCQHGSAWLPPVHATVVFRSKPSAFHRSAFRTSPSCNMEHVDWWPNGTRLFVKPGGERTVRLTFGRMSLSDRGSVPVEMGFGRRPEIVQYTLLIDVGTTPLDDGKRLKTGMEQCPEEWSWSSDGPWDDLVGEDDAGSEDEDDSESDGGNVKMIEQKPVNFVSVRFINSRSNTV